MAEIILESAYEATILTSAILAEKGEEPYKAAGHLGTPVPGSVPPWKKLSCPTWISHWM